MPTETRDTWGRIRRDPHRKKHHAGTYRERNNRTFNNSFITANACTNRTHLDISLQIGQLYDREGLCISKKEGDYIQEISPEPEDMTVRDGREQQLTTVDGGTWGTGRALIGSFQSILLLLCYPAGLLM